MAADVADDIVARLVAALLAHDGEVLSACLAPEVTLELLPAGEAWVGHDAVLEAAGRLLTAFPDLGWSARARWLDEGQIVEEGTWRGTLTGPLGTWPTTPGKTVSLAARTFVEHDGASVRCIRVFTDLAGLRVALGLPVSGAAAAGATTTTLRTAPDRELRVFVRPPDAQPPAPGKGAGRAGASPPPRRSRRTAVVTLFALLLVLVAGGAFAVRRYGLPEAVTAALPGTAVPSSPAATPTTTTTASANPTVGASPTQTRTTVTPKVTSTPAPGVTRRGNDFDLSTDVLFGVGKSDLTDKARTAVKTVARIIIEQKVMGGIEVKGYTDNTGSAASNMVLSKKRADVVATLLKEEVKGLDIQVNATGYGEGDPVADNGTKAGQAKNRRVTIQLPAQATATP